MKTIKDQSFRDLRDDVREFKNALLKSSESNFKIFIAKTKVTK